MSPGACSRGIRLKIWGKIYKDDINDISDACRRGGFGYGHAVWVYPGIGLANMVGIRSLR